MASAGRFVFVARDGQTCDASACLAPGGPLATGAADALRGIATPAPRPAGTRITQTLAITGAPRVRTVTR